MTNSEAVGMLMNSQYYKQGYTKGVSDVLDKIRTEIEFEVDHRTNMLCAEDVFTILDKYKARSEEVNDKRRV